MSGLRLKHPGPPKSPRVPLNDLSRGIKRDRDLLDGAARRVMDSGYVVMGPIHKAFEVALADYLGVAAAVGVASGTDALELAIRAAMPRDKGTVLAAANAGGYTSTAARRAGYGLRYADIDPVSLCLTTRTVESALTPDVGVVVVTHLYGNLTDIESLVRTCRERGVRVVEDCAQAIGARRGARKAGSYGDLAAISFYPTKNLGALGDGGAVVTNEVGLADTVAKLRQYGWASKYQVELPGGVNSRLDEIQAAFLLARLPMLDSLNERRRSIVARYVAASKGDSLRVLPADGPHHVAHLAVALVGDRQAAVEHFARCGVQTDVHFPVPDHLQSGFGAGPQSLPVTEQAAKEVLTLPCFPELTDAEVRRVCDAIGSLA